MREELITLTMIGNIHVALTTRPGSLTFGPHPLYRRKYRRLTRDGLEMIPWAGDALPRGPEERGLEP